MSTRILALDTATEACSVALWNEGEIHSLFEICPREHTQRILPMVQQVLADSGLTLKDLDALAFGQGPGSFTGVRIGIGIAQGLALGADLPLLGVSSLATWHRGLSVSRRPRTCWRPLMRGWAKCTGGATSVMLTAAGRVNPRKRY